MNVEIFLVNAISREYVRSFFFCFRWLIARAQQNEEVQEKKKDKLKIVEEKKNNIWNSLGTSSVTRLLFASARLWIEEIIRRFYGNQVAKLQLENGKENDREREKKGKTNIIKRKHCEVAKEYTLVYMYTYTYILCIYIQATNLKRKGLATSHFQRCHHHYYSHIFHDHVNSRKRSFIFFCFFIRINLPFCKFAHVDKIYNV